MNHSRDNLRKLGFDFDSEGRFQMLPEASSDVSSTNTSGFVSFDDDQDAFLEKDMDDVHNEIQNLVIAMLENIGMELVVLPNGTDLTTFIYATSDWKSNSKLLILIQSSGEFGPGIWSMEAIVKGERGLHQGTQLAYVERAKASGMGVVILNPNMNSRYVECGEYGECVAIAGSETSHDHLSSAFDYVFKQRAAAAAAAAAASAAAGVGQFVAIVAHGDGGSGTVELSNAFPTAFEKRVKSVHLIDSNHEPQRVSDFLQETAFQYVHYPLKKANKVVGRNEFMDWKRSAAAIKPLASSSVQAKQSLKDVTLISAGKIEETDYKWTPDNVIDSVFTRLNEAFCVHAAF